MEVEEVTREWVELEVEAMLWVSWLVLPWPMLSTLAETTEEEVVEDTTMIMIAETDR